MKKIKDFDKKLKEGFTKDELKILSANYGECSGCTPTTPNGACYIINGVCTWVPEIG